MNCLVDKNGKVAKCDGGKHKGICKKQFGMALQTFLKRRGGLRIMLYGECLAVEHYKPLSKIQNAVVKKILEKNLIYELITVASIKQSFSRPIRSYNG